MKKKREYIPRPLRRAVIERDRDTCRYCGGPASWRKSGAHIDHIVPLSEGGATTIDNLVTACCHCNMQKSNKTPGQWGYVVLPIDT